MWRQGWGSRYFVNFGFKKRDYFQMLSRGKITTCKTGDGKGNNFPKEEEPYLKMERIKSKMFETKNENFF
jgi:hypothetical protein